MSRELPVNVEVVDQFPIWEIDGFDKITGLVSGDFEVTVYLDGVVQASYPVTLTEIGSTGEYKIAFTPTGLGFWVVEAQYGRQDYAGEYDVVTWTLDEVADLMLVTKALVHDNAVLDQQEYNHTYRGRKYLTDARLRAYDSRANALAAGATGLLYTFTIYAEYTDDEQTLYRVTRQ